MRISGRAMFSLFLAAVAGGAIFAARGWPMKAALFPLVMAIPLLALALVQLVLDLRDRQPATPAGEADGIARRRTAGVFGWMGLFIVLVFLIGFPLTVPVWMFAHLLVDGGVGWLRAGVLTAAAWGGFYGLFERLLRFPFEPGLVQTWLGT